MNIKILVISLIFLGIFEFIFFFLILKIHKIEKNMDSDFIEDNITNYKI